MAGLVDSLKSKLKLPGSGGGSDDLTQSVSQAQKFLVTELKPWKDFFAFSKFSKPAGIADVMYRGGMFALVLYCPMSRALFTQ